MALLKLSQPVPTSPFVGLVCLPFDNSNMFVGNQLIASGWGKLTENGEFPPDLRATTLIGVSYYDCSMAHAMGVHIEDHVHLCAVKPNLPGGICQGDAGGENCCYVFLHFIMCDK
jgi:hypothetical protein